MGGLSYFTTRHFLLAGRESAAQHQAFANAVLVRNSLQSGNTQLRLAPDATSTPGPTPIRSCTTSPRRTCPPCRSTPRPSPASCARWCCAGTAATQTYRTPQGTAEIVVGVPVPSEHADLLRGVRPVRPRPHAARPRADPLRCRRRHDPPRHRARPLRQRALSPAAGRRVTGGRRHRRRRPGHPPRPRRRRPRPRRPHQLLQHHGRPATGAHRARGALQLRREPRAPLSAHHPGRLARGARGGPRRAAGPLPAGAAAAQRRPPALPAHGGRPARDVAGRCRLCRRLPRGGERLRAGAALGRGGVGAHGRAPQRRRHPRSASTPRCALAGGRGQAPLRACHGQPDGERRPLRRWGDRDRGRAGRRREGRGGRVDDAGPGIDPAERGQGVRALLPRLGLGPTWHRAPAPGWALRSSPSTCGSCTVASASSPPPRAAHVLCSRSPCSRTGTSRGEEET